MLELSFQLLFNILFAISASFLKIKAGKTLENPSLRIHNIENLDLAFDRLRLYTILIVLHFVSQIFLVLDSLVQLASVCYGSSVDMTNLTGHAAEFERPTGFSGLKILQELLFHLNVASMESGAKFIDLTWSFQTSTFHEFRYNVRMQSFLSVLTGRLAMLDSYVSPILVNAHRKMLRIFFKSLLNMKNN